jgi:hypothetical protein
MAAHEGGSLRANGGVKSVVIDPAPPHAHAAATSEVACGVLARLLAYTSMPDQCPHDDCYDWMPPPETLVQVSDLLCLDAN